MSTNKTKNYHLHQWSPSDPVSLPEVNGNFAVLDAAVARAQEVAEALPYVIGSHTGAEGVFRPPAEGVRHAATLRRGLGRLIAAPTGRNHLRPTS